MPQTVLQWKKFVSYIPEEIWGIQNIRRIRKSEKWHEAHWSLKVIPAPKSNVVSFGLSEASDSCCAWFISAAIRVCPNFWFSLFSKNLNFGVTASPKDLLKKTSWNKNFLQKATGYPKMKPLKKATNRTGIHWMNL